MVLNMYMAVELNERAPLSFLRMLYISHLIKRAAIRDDDLTG